MSSATHCGRRGAQQLVTFVAERSIHALRNSHNNTLAVYSGDKPSSHARKKLVADNNDNHLTRQRTANLLTLSPERDERKVKTLCVPNPREPSENVDHDAEGCPRAS